MPGPCRSPALTVDAVWISRDRILLVRRAHYPFQGGWALPGGFVNLRETVEAAVSRELREETGLVASPRALLGVYSGPDRDPRKPTTTVAFLMRGRVRTPHGGDDAREARWIRLTDANGLAFDHDRIVSDARRWIRNHARRRRSARRRKTRPRWIQRSLRAAGR